MIALEPAPPSTHRGWLPQTLAGVVYAIVLALPYVHLCGVLGQMSVLLLFLIVATGFLAERGEEWAGRAKGDRHLVGTGFRPLETDAARSQSPFAADR